MPRYQYYKWDEWRDAPTRDVYTYKDGFQPSDIYRDMDEAAEEVIEQEEAGECEGYPVASGKHEAIFYMREVFDCGHFGPPVLVSVGGYWQAVYTAREAGSLVDLSAEELRGVCVPPEAEEEEATDAESGDESDG